MVDFDTVALHFDAPRALPPGVATLIRNALWRAIEIGPRGQVLEIGAGTGRIGHAFKEAGDAYVGVDLSRGMLNQFVARMGATSDRAPELVQGDGQALPFADDTFDVVLLVQVLSNTHSWRQVLGEAKRVMRAEGGLALGQTVPPVESLDRRMRDQLTKILAEMGASAGVAGARLPEAVAWLAPHFHCHTHLSAAAWEQVRTPRQFLARHLNGARFAALPQEVRETALSRLEDWVRATLGAPDAGYIERWTFELDVFAF